MTTPSSTIVIEATTRDGLLEKFASRWKHLTRAQIQQRFDDLLQHGYADAIRAFDGKWRFVLIGKLTSE